MEACGSIRHKLILCAFVVFGGGALALSAAQSGPVAAGGVAVGTGGEVSFSLGQVDNSIASGTGGTLLEGLQQPEDSLATAATRPAYVPAAFRVAARFSPAAHAIVLDVRSGGGRELGVRVCNAQGKLILESGLREGRSYLPVGRLASSIYILNILRNHELLEQLKLVKE